MGEEARRENARMAIEDAVFRMLEAGFSAQEVTAEVEYALENAEDTSGQREENE